MQQQRFANLLLYRMQGVKRCHGLLKNHPNVESTELPHFFLRHRRELSPFKDDPACQNLAMGARKKLIDRECGHTLSAARLSHDPEGLSPWHGEAHAVHGDHSSSVRIETGDEVLDLKDGVTHGIL